MDARRYYWSGSCISRQEIDQHSIPLAKLRGLSKSSVSSVICPSCSGNLSTRISTWLGCATPAVIRGSMLPLPRQAAKACSELGSSQEVDPFPLSIFAGWLQICRRSPMDPHARGTRSTK